MRKILIFGSNGMLGYAVTEYFRKNDYLVKTINRNEFDIAKDNHGKLSTLLDDTDIVINCAGVIKPRIKVMPVIDVLRVNSIFPHNLAKTARQKFVKCIHITTDCVYNGKKGNYDETDLFDADDLYGISKSVGDAAECMVLRTSILGEENGQSRSLLEWTRSQKGKEVNGFLNHNWNGVTTTYLAELIDTIIKNNLYMDGLYHIHSPNSVNKFELLSVINDIYNLKMDIKPAFAEESVNRTLTSVKHFSSMFCTKSIEKQLAEMKLFFSNLLVLA